MHQKLQPLLKIRGVKIILEVFFILLVYLIIKSWMTHSMVAGPAPQINAQLLNGEEFNLQAIKGKPVLVHFWASWCGICKMEQNSIEAISKDYRVISVAMKSGNVSEVQQFMSENKLSFATINDPTGDLAQRYGVRAVPASFIINSQGNISFRETGYTTEWGLRIRLWLAAK